MSKLTKLKTQLANMKEEAKTRTLRNERWWWVFDDYLNGERTKNGNYATNEPAFINGIYYSPAEVLKAINPEEYLKQRDWFFEEDETFWEEEHTDAIFDLEDEIEQLEKGV